MGYKRRILLINKKFQLRFALYVCSWLFALSLVYPMIIFNLFDYFARSAALDPMGPALANLKQTKSEMLELLILLQLLFMGVTFLITIFMSHRIAGPLYKLKKFMLDAKQGNFNNELYFRKADHFQDLAIDYNEMMSGIRGILGRNTASTQAAIERIEKALEHADRPGRRELEEALTLLREVGERTRSAS